MFETIVPDDQYIVPSFEGSTAQPEKPQTPEFNESIATPAELLGIGVSIIAYRELVIKESNNLNKAA